MFFSFYDCALLWCVYVHFYDCDKALCLYEHASLRLLLLMLDVSRVPTLFPKFQRRERLVPVTLVPITNPDCLKTVPSTSTPRRLTASISRWKSNGLNL